MRACVRVCSVCACVCVVCVRVCSVCACVCVVCVCYNVFVLATDNAIPVKSWFNDPHDTALLDLLPMLDALRFSNDVRSILSRNLHLHKLW